LVNEAVGTGGVFIIGSQRVAGAGFGMLRKSGEYLWSPSRRQLAEERAGKGWKLQQIQPERVQLNIAPTMTQVVEISQVVHVAYPVEWLRAQIKLEYVTVTLLSGSVV
jgi:hypothetical protein